MYSRKTLEPSMEPLETSTLIGYCSEDFQCRTTQSYLLLRKDKTKQIPDDKFRQS